MKRKDVLSSFKQKKFVQLDGKKHVKGGNGKWISGVSRNPKCPPPIEERIKNATS